ncbi:MAG: glucose-6-phosphate 1-dehydrogenase, partial [Solirubrobacteraceae bacterium]|nr:glucose-6-phosphate 1-dehydrogenase [Solirubrobacteraceae bacterium]
MSTAPPPQQERNPLTEALERQPVHSTALVIFGATGDLARRKLLPALYNLAHEGALPEHFALIGNARSELSDGEFRELAVAAVKEFSRREPDEKVLAKLFERARYVGGSFDQDAVYEGLESKLGEVDEEAGEALNRCFYLSTAPEFFPVIVKQLGEHALDDRDGAEVRVIIEKPFGTRLAEARELNEIVLSVFEERQVFRIDHYLGKET